MSRQINFERFQPNTEIPESRDYREAIKVTAKCAISINSNEDPDIKARVELLLEENPGKYNYTQQEVASIINMSYPFVNRNCKKGLINTTKYGRKELVSIYELARISIQGVIYGN